jgi:acetoin utilization protein AcuB
MIPWILSAKAYKPWTTRTDGHGRPRRAADNAMIGAFRNEGAPMALGDIMTAGVVTVEMDDRLGVVKEIFDTQGFHHLLVTDENKKLSGIVSDRDLLRALSPYVGSAAETARDLATLNKRVHQIMTRHPLTLRPQSGIAEAVNLLLAHRISCIPIVDDDFKPVGIVSWRDLLKSLAAK